MQKLLFVMAAGGFFLPSPLMSQNLDSWAYNLGAEICRVELSNDPRLIENMILARIIPQKFCRCVSEAYELIALGQGNEMREQLNDLINQRNIVQANSFFSKIWQTSATYCISVR